MAKQREREKNSNLEIRKLTPLECCRLMGADDSVFYALRDIAKLSDIQMYHIFGDGLIASIPEKIINKMKGDL